MKLFIFLAIYLFFLIIIIIIIIKTLTLGANHVSLLPWHETLSKPPLPQFVMYTITLNTPRYNLYIFFNNLNNSTIFF